MQVDQDLSSLTLAELKERCKEAGVAVSGKKEELVTRLVVHRVSQQLLQYDGLEERSLDQLKALATAVMVETKGTKKVIHDAIVAKLRETLAPLSEDALKQILQERGADIAGSKAELVDRLVSVSTARDEKLRLKQDSGGLVDIPVGAPGAPKKTIKIASFNLANMTSDSRHKRYDRVVELLSRFDVITCQEVLKDDVMDFLVKQMPAGYAYVQSDRQVGRVRKEYYAVLYNSNTVKCVQHAVFNDERADLFEREPFVATFACVGKGAMFDFTVMTIHVLFGDAKKDRRGELQSLAVAAKKVLEANGKERDLIVTGDFNMEPTDEGWQDLKALGFCALFHAPQKTTVGDVSLFDNIWLQPSVTGPHFVRRGCVEWDKEWYPEETLKARNEVSDHRPVWVEMKADGDLDENVYGSFQKLAL